MLLDVEHLKNKYGISCSGVAHIGAHFGQEISEYKKHFGNIEIHLFEPQKEIFSKLIDEFKDQRNIFFYNTALGEEQGTTLMFNADNDGQSSSILEPKLHLEIHPEVVFENSQNIDIDTFDNFYLNNVNFLNIDTQGYELKVLMGAENSLLKNIDYIICEVNKKELYKDCALVKDVDNYLRNFGFIRTDTHFWQDKYPWGDAFYIKKKYLKKSTIFFSKFKNFIYSFDYLFPLIIALRNFLWKMRDK